MKPFFILLLFIPAFCSVCAGTRPDGARIVVDDPGVTDVGFMGDVPDHAPNIDRLASQSMVFREGYAAAANLDVWRSKHKAPIPTEPNPRYKT
ncbi:MAG TPA: hypothetical protein VJ952_06060 [Opitutales bacterium]|nr:hypothetical protein [Opitutales bacterium]